MCLVGYAIKNSFYDGQRSTALESAVAYAAAPKGYEFRKRCAAGKCVRRYAAVDNHTLQTVFGNCLNQGGRERVQVRNKKFRYIYAALEGVLGSLFKLIRIAYTHRMKSRAVFKGSAAYISDRTQVDCRQFGTPGKRSCADVPYTFQKVKAFQVYAAAESAFGNGIQLRQRGYSRYAGAIYERLRSQPLEV